MKLTVADTYFYLAILNIRDTAHRLAIDTSDRLPGQIVTTDLVLVEVADAMCSSHHRSKFLDLLDLIEADGRTQVIRSNEQLFRVGVELYRQRSDKDSPLTDCISFVVMRQQGLNEALTADHHFEQAGFVALLMPG